MKKPIIDQLYDGEVYPAEQIVPKHPGYRAVCREYSEYREKVAAILGDEDAERMSLLQMEMHDYVLKDTFAYGLRFGLFLMMELLDLEDQG